MIEFTSSFVEFALATFIAIYGGMFLVIILSNITGVNTRYLSAYALGLLFWFFFDAMNDAVQLGVNEGYVFEFRQTGLVLLFIGGFLALALLGNPSDRNVMKRKRFPLLLGILTGIGLGIHGIGEGLEFGGLAAGTQATSVLGAIGGGSGLSYVLHKLLESTIIIVIFLGLARTQSLSSRDQLRQSIFVGLAFGIPSVIGEAGGYYMPIDASYSFALGAGAALSVALQVSRLIFSRSSDDELNYSQWIGVSLAVLLGFFLLYGTALFHS